MGETDQILFDSIGLRCVQEGGFVEVVLLENLTARHGHLSVQ